MSFKFNSNAVSKLLKDKIDNFKCPMCLKEDFILVEGFVNHAVSTSLDSSNEGVSISSVVTCCKNCGYMSFHAAIPLGVQF